VARIIEKRPDDTLGIVVSAMGGMTDSLLDLLPPAQDDKTRFAADLQRISERYAEAAGDLLDGDDFAALLDQWHQDAANLTEVVNAIEPGKLVTQHTRDVVAGYGEIWSARLLAALLKKTLGEQRGGSWIDARQLITLRDGELGPAAVWDASQANWHKLVDEDFTGVVVITGFIASDEAGEQTTLGRNGSDHSAAIVAALSGASQLTIWTDVDGVMSADPNKVPDAQIIDALSYNEAMELAYFGASVIHPQTLAPAVANGIPIVIRNSFNEAHGGTRISAESESQGQIKGITAVSSMALINLEGSGMIGVPGTADRLFGALKNAAISVTLISQASSEHSICVAVPKERASLAKEVVEKAFAEELEGGSATIWLALQDWRRGSLALSGVHE